MRCHVCKTEIDCCRCRENVFYRVKPFDWNVAQRNGTSYAIEEVRVVATSRNKEDADRLVERLNEWKKLKRDNANLRAKLELRDTGKVALYRVENIVEDEIAKTSVGWFHGSESLGSLKKRIMTRLGWVA